MNLIICYFISGEDVPDVQNPGLNYAYQDHATEEDSSMNHDYSEEAARDNFYDSPHWNPEITIKRENQQESNNFMIHQNYPTKPKSSEKKFCEICNKSFSRKLFGRHLQTVHPTEGHLIEKRYVHSC